MNNDIKEIENYIHESKIFKDKNELNVYFSLKKRKEVEEGKDYIIIKRETRLKSIFKNDYYFSYELANILIQDKKKGKINFYKRKLGNINKKEKKLNKLFFQGTKKYEIYLKYEHYKKIMFLNKIENLANLLGIKKEQILLFAKNRNINDYKELENIYKRCYLYEY